MNHANTKYSRIVILFCCFLLVILLCIFGYNVHFRGDVHSQRVACLRVIYHDIQNMATANGKHEGCLPSVCRMSPEINCDVSWRFLCAYDLRGGTESYEYFRYDEPWNSPTNIKAWNASYCWSARPDHSKKRFDDPEEQKKYWTNVMGIVGPDTVFDLQDPEKFIGCEHLIFIISTENSGIHWGQPGDIDYRHLPKNFFNETNEKGFYAMFFDGTIWFIKKNVPFDLLVKFFTVKEAKENDRNTELIKHATPLYAP